MDLDVADDLYTEDSYIPLSARQGVVLREMIENVATDAEIDSIFNN